MYQEEENLSVKRIPIIFEDNWLLAIDKPAGVVVNRAATTKNKLTIEDWLVATKRGEGVARNGIVHRLDKDTCGIMLIAKTQVVLEKLQNQFKQRQVQKEYLTLVHGVVVPKSGRVLAPITRSPFNRQRFGVFIGGRRAETEYEVIKTYQREHEKFSLVKVKPLTGRTHQIRIHMKHLNHPVVGDEWYAGRKTYQRDKKWCGRLWLQAIKISFVHPNSNTKMSLESDLNSELDALLKTIEKG